MILAGSTVYIGERKWRQRIGSHGYELKTTAETLGTMVGFCAQLKIPRKKDVIRHMLRESERTDRENDTSVGQRETRVCGFVDFSVRQDKGIA